MKIVRFLGHCKARTMAVLACAGLAALGWVLVLERIDYEGQRVVAEVVRQNENLVQAFEQQAIRTLQSVDQALRFLRHEYGDKGAALELDKLFASGAINAEVARSASIIDASGKVILSSLASGADVSDRAFFRAHRDDSSDRMLVAEPVASRIDGRPVVVATRRLSGADGSFQGVAAVALRPEYLADFSRDIDVGNRGVIQLVGLDGVGRVRRVGATVSYGVDMRGTNLLMRAAQAPAGSFVSRGIFEGNARFMSYRTLSGHPFVVAVGTDMNESLAELRARERNYYAAAGAATLLLALLGGLIALAMARQDRSAAERLRAEARFRDLVDNTSDFIWETNAAIEFVYASNNISVLLGLSPEEVLGKRPFDLMPPDERERVQAWFAPLLAAGKGFANLETVFHDVNGNLRTWETNGAPFLDSNGGLLGYRGVSRDITARKAAEATLERQAHYDALTQLPNRVLCFDRLAQAITQAKRRQWNTGVLSIDLDRFKNVNDTLGHAAGDALLREAARRLVSCVRAGDTVARVGGDEFAVVLSELSDPQDAGAVATNILEAMATPLLAGTHEVFVTASIGIAICPPDGEDGEVLLRNADAAMSRAKQLGRNNFQFYAAEMNARAMDQLVLEGQLRRALQRGEYFLHYQPKASIDSSRITGFEALLRWRRADGRVVPPGEFIPLLEDSGMIVPVGEWVIRTACAQIRAWRQAGLEAVPIAVNVSAKQFHHELYEVIERALREYGVEPRMLEVEITESDAMRDPERAIRALGRLKALGVAVSIDDFGTGYSSLGYLKRFPVDKLKLDRSFVTGLPDNADDISITRAVISMAHSLGLEVVAEGVETDAQRGFLAHHRCDQMQGYLLSRPVTPEACAALLEAAGALALS